MGKGFWEEGGEEERRNKSQGKEERQGEGGRSGEIMKEEAERTGSPRSPACPAGAVPPRVRRDGTLRGYPESLRGARRGLCPWGRCGHPQHSTVPRASTADCPSLPTITGRGTSAPVTEVPRETQGTTRGITQGTSC